MKRDWNLEEISDGKKYNLTDMVKADCDDCKNCSACCHDMGNSIVLDPFDFDRLSKHLNMRFEGMLGKNVELNMVDGVILPNLKMDVSKKDSPCVFLNEEGRCSIHPYRPGICRIFPLARLYENNSFSYILQVHECAKENKSKVKVSKWIDTPRLEENQKFISDWHYFIKEAGQKILECENEENAKQAAMVILQSFYIEPFSEEEEEGDFYSQFTKRLIQSKKLIERLLK